MSRSRGLRSAFQVLPLAFLAACDAPPKDRPQAGEAWFEDTAAEAGLDFVHVRAAPQRFWLPEIMSGGAAWMDYDGDGDPDLYLVQGGKLAEEDSPAGVNRLFRNDGGRFTDVTEGSGTGDGAYGMGAAAADYDRDGDLDLYVTNVGPNVLFRNEGNGRFSDVSAETGTGHSGWGASAAWLDYDGDGDLDLFVTNYVNWSPGQELECFSGSAERDYCHPRHFNAPAADVLYRNDGGRFTDVTQDSGIWKSFGYGLGVAVGDFNSDGLPDIYVANDGMPNQLWLNRGDGRFEDRALITGTAVNLSGMAEAGMGIGAADLENDGDTDLFVTHLRGETNTLYLNDGGIFGDVTAKTGLAAVSVPFTGFGTGFHDFDNDGHLDVYVGNGRVGLGFPGARTFAEPNHLFRGQGGVSFELVNGRGGTGTEVIDNSRAVAFADYDGDGGMDAVIVNNGERVRLLRNIVGGGRNWLSLDVIDENGIEASGARVEVMADGRRQWRTVDRSSSYLASNSGRVHVGMGDASVADEVTVHWPDGSETRYGPLAARAAYSLKRGAAEAIRISPARADSH